MSLISTLLLNKPISLPAGKWRNHYMDNKAPNLPPHSVARRALSVNAVVDVLRRGILMTIDDVAEATGLSRKTVAFVLHELLDTGRARVCKNGKKSFYGLTEVA